jgi:UbiD family decarboxylase
MASTGVVHAGGTELRRRRIRAPGGIMGRPVELTKAECVSLPIPAHAEFVIEGVLRQDDMMPEASEAH